MSININVVANKPEFNNFFSEQIVLPVNCEASMAKANIDIPILQMVSVVVPNITDAPDDNRAKTCLKCNVDGIKVNITWRDLYNAHSSFANIDIDAGVSEDDYFSGLFEYIPNNKLVLVPNNGLTEFVKIAFPSVLAKALQTKFEFYEITVDMDLQPNNVDSVVNITPAGASTFDAPNFTSNQGEFFSTQLKGFSIIATYNPQKQVERTRTNNNFDAIDVNNWQRSNANQDLETDGVSVCSAWFNNGASISPNGGYSSTKINLNDASSKMAYGISLEGVAHETSEYTPIIATYSPELLDVGFEFSIVNGERVYNIIDGQREYVYYDSNTNAEVVSDLPIYHPVSPILKFENLDTFFIQIQRGNLYNGTTEFVIRLYQGTDEDLLDSNNTKLIYVAKRTLNSPAIKPNIGLFGDIGLANSFVANKFVNRTDQDNLQASWFSSSYPVTENEPSAQMIGSIQFEIERTESFLTVNNDEFLFWSAYFDRMNDTMGVANVIIKRVMSSIESKNQVVKANFKTNFTTNNSFKTFFLGRCDINDVYRTVGGLLQINNQSVKSLLNLPKELKVSINNMPIKSYQGKYNVAGDSNQFSTTSGGEQRIIGTIPLPVVLDDDTNIPITYEPFNMTFKPMNNPEPFMVNQLLVEIFFQDYDTNQRKKFDSVNGFLSLDLNFRQGAKPPPIMNNIRAI